MTRPERLLLGGSLLVLLGGAPAAAQHMYLDANGDGLHSAADVLQPSGTTTLDLWLRTNADRDGNPVECNTGDGDLTINAYEFILHATNGTIAWGAVTNRLAGSNPAAVLSDATDLHAGASGNTLPPGTYHLASIEATPAVGTPSIGIAPSTGLSGAFLTGFGSQCSGLDFSNTIVLGVDWFDADGVPFGGVANAPPTIDPIPDLVVEETSILSQPMSARDPDGTPLQFFKTSGPAYMSVSTTDPGQGVATGLIRLTPGLGDAGATTASVQVSDGITAARSEFQVTVVNLNRAPTLDQPADMVVFTGRESSQDLYASDPDGGTLQFLLVSGPGYAAVTTIDPFAPARGRVTFTPSDYDEGTETVTVAASDGLLQSERSFSVRAFRVVTYGSLLCRPYDMTVVAGSQAEQVILVTPETSGPITLSLVDTPSFVSLTPQNTSSTPRTALLRVAPSPGDLGVHSATVQVDDGTEPARETCRITVVSEITPEAPRPDLLTSSFRSYNVCDIPQGAVLADLNRDGRLDLVTPNYGCGLSVLLGIGTGQFADRRDVPLDGNPKGVEVADLDGDGDLDAAVSIGFGDRIAILAGDGQGSLQQVNALPAGSDAAYVAIADLNRDGIPDLAGADEQRNTISIYLGTGGLGYGERRIYPAGSAPCYTAVADWTGDGIPDVAAANENSNAVTLHAGIGDGTFAPAVFLATGAGPSSVLPGDFDEDGHPDMAASDFHTHLVTILFGDGQGSFPRRVDLETGNAPWSLTVDDVNGDGHLDVVSADTGEDDVGVILGNGDGTFRPVLRSPTGSIPRFVTTGDLDGDHRKDLVVANEIGGTVSILMGRGDGSFGSSLSIEGVPTYDLVAGDVTGDGLADLVSVNENLTAEVQVGLGGGRFGSRAPLTAGGLPAQGMKLADVNGDAILDLLLPLTEESWALYAGGPSFAQSAPTLVSAGGRATAFAVGDWNRDGRTDVALTALPEPRVTLLHGDGAGGFGNRRDVTLPGPASAITPGDWDGDGVLDLAVGVGPGGVAVLWGDGAGFAVGPTLPFFEGVGGLTSGDLNGDGRAELVAVEAGSGGGIGIFRKGPHTRIAIYAWASREAAATRAVYPGGSLSRAPSLADLTGDGLLDLLVAEGGANAIGVLPGLGGGAFGPSRDYGVGAGPLAYAVADWDGDGRLDVAASSLRLNAITLIRNLGGGEPPPLAARAFVMPGDATLRLVAAKPATCLHLEPVQSSFATDDVDLSSVRLARADSDAAPIAPAPSKTALVADADRNGVPEVVVCFGRADLRALFADVRGVETIPVVLTGALADGRAFRADMAWRVAGAPGGPPVVRVAPNPSNPTAVLSFTLERQGRLRVTVHDVQGRVVARLSDTKAAPAGEHRFRLGSGARAGVELASGIYFYRVETGEGVRTGRFTVLK